MPISLLPACFAGRKEHIHVGAIGESPLVRLVQQHWCRRHHALVWMVQFILALIDGSGEYFDLGQKLIVRVPFAIGRASSKGGATSSSPSTSTTSSSWRGSTRRDYSRAMFQKGHTF